MTQETTQEDVDGPGGMTPFGPEQAVLFDMYSIPADWPREVPIMSEFKVTIYERTVDGSLSNSSTSMRSNDLRAYGRRHDGEPHRKRSNEPVF
ncbi:MAG: hypothetical protein JW817_06445 [Clostridiales bacterium]|nr:hypothetical protein [Clostridiales bacterium]